MIKLYIYNLGGFLNKAAFNSKAEKNRLMSEKAYELLSSKLSELFGNMPVIKKTDSGKPYIENLPVYISISHTGDMAFLAISDSEIGVDIERERAFSSHMTARLFSENELEYINNGDKNEHSTILWCLREAVCKATGEGFSEWFFSCSFADCNGNLLSKYGDYNLKVINNDGYICAVAGASPLEEATLIVDSL